MSNHGSTGSADEYTVKRYETGGAVYRNGERIGHYWKDKWSGYAAFRSGLSKPVARPRTEAGCIRKLTGGALTHVPRDDQ
ncbi:hypothetical protein H4W33_006460 [Kibdelosporangium phytohabitans]|nr:hypothetical protein [Kibdelosporangium phytohabitans]